MEKSLGLKVAPDHIGWAVVGTDENGERSVLDKGVLMFDEAYIKESGRDKSRAEKRSQSRRLRRSYSRHRLRKVRLLRLLIPRGLAPRVPDEQLDGWLKHKQFPEDPAFRGWFHTDEKGGKNPYRDRYECLTRKLDLEHSERDRFILGRAFYHINQRRGFLSNRLDTTPEREDGVVWSGINELDIAMAEAGCEYLGEYFYQLYGKEPIRCRYTERERHYQKEFRAICQKQDLPEAFAEAVYREIFFQREIAQPKKLVGHCKFEKSKTRCLVSRPEFEEFRALCFINNIKVARPGESEMTPLSPEEKASIMPKFFRKSKPHFYFSDLAVTLAGKKAEVVYVGQEHDGSDCWCFNYRKDAAVDGCPVTASLCEIFGGDWIAGVRSRYTRLERKDGRKSDLEIVNDIWHVLKKFTLDALVVDWAQENLGLSEKEAEAFSKIRFENKYGNLSLKAICKALPYLREGLRYDQAMMLANAGAVFGAGAKDELVQRGREIIRDVVINYDVNPDIPGDSKMRKIEENLCNEGIFNFDLRRMYHPSMIETFPKVTHDRRVGVRLGSPRTDSLRNPAVERAEFRLSHLLNTMLKEGVIERDTRVSLMLSRQLNEKNMRKAIEDFQKRNEEKRSSYRAAIEAFYKSHGIDCVPSDDDVLKYELWEEQKHLDIYTGKSIGIADFLGPESSYDIEHTFPLSRGGDDSKENKTLCNWRFNRMVKGARIPSELDNHDGIMGVIATLGWQERIELLKSDIARQKMNSRTSALPEDRDRAVSQRHLDELELRYLEGKLWRFTAKEVPEKMSRRLDVDVAYIAKYAKAYLESVFDKVFIEKRETVASFRKMWGLPAFRNERNIVSFSESCIDAAVMASVTGKEYRLWTSWKADYDKYLFADGRKPDPVLKPWPTFTEDMKALSESVLSNYYHAGGLLKMTRKRLRKNGKLVKGADGEPRFVTGDAVRGSLNKESYYGAIKRDGEIRYVIKKKLTDLEVKDLENIVDDGMRGYVRGLMRRLGSEAVRSSNESWKDRVSAAIGKPLEEFVEDDLERIEDEGLYAKVKGFMDDKGVAGFKKGVLDSWSFGACPKSVRVFCTMVKNPFTLKRQAYASRFDYKNEIHVMNDENYAMAFYEGTDGKGKDKVRTVMLSNFEAVRRRKEVAGGHLFPEVDGNGFRLKFILRAGTLVLFYENDRSEVFSASPSELSRRLYRVTGISQQNGRGIVMFKHHLEARTPKEIGKSHGAWSSDDAYRGRFTVVDSKIKAFVEGVDFRITATGKIDFLK